MLNKCSQREPLPLELFRLRQNIMFTKQGIFYTKNRDQLRKNTNIMICGRGRISAFIMKRILIPFLLLAIAYILPGCKPVEFYQKARLVNPIMTFDTDPTEIHFTQKSYYSREGSVGGVGTTAGGGCGCY